MTTLGKYELHEQLGKGGFGTVYRATDTSLGREVALKILHPQLMVDETFVERFIREARTLASLEHPNIVPVYDLGEVDGRLFIAMRYLPGGNLQELIRKAGSLDFQHSLRIMSQVCDALQVAHEKGLVHRDIKPANILFDKRENALVSDFGLARAVQLSASSMSSTSVGAGTPAYRAPELWRGKPPATPATDVYSLGCMLAEMLTGKMLFNGETPDEILTQHLIDGPTLPEQFGADCPQSLKTILMKALSKNPAERQKDSQSFLMDISSPQIVSTPVIKINSIQVENTVQPKVIEALPISSPQATHIREISLDLGDGVSMEFVHVPAGEFLMGSDPKVDKMAEEDELPQHTVYLDEYWIGKYPVTTRQFIRYLAGTNEEYQKRWKNLSSDEEPIVNVTWEDAQQFCKWMASKSGKNIALPTEAQWEKAARGTNGRTYPWGDGEANSERAKYLGSRGKIESVGQHPLGISPYGAYDMAGNVWDWVADWYKKDYYSRLEDWKNPLGPIGNFNTKVIRGGCWNSYYNVIRCAFRDRRIVNESSEFIGFRCVLV